MQWMQWMNIEAQLFDTVMYALLPVKIKIRGTSRKLFRFLISRFPFQYYQINILRTKKGDQFLNITFIFNIPK